MGRQSVYLLLSIETYRHTQKIKKKKKKKKMMHLVLYFSFSETPRNKHKSP